MRRSADFRVWRWVLGCGMLAALGCGDESGLAPAPVRSDVERDGWVDAASLVSGDGATDFVSGTPSDLELHRYFQFQDPEDTAAGPVAVDGQRIYGLSSYAGLVITDASASGPSRVEGRYRLDGIPFSISEAGGIVLALVNEYPGFVCQAGPLCAVGGVGHIVLIDARVPSAPTLLAERRVLGTITHAQRVGDVLYIVSRELAPCAECRVIPETAATITALGLADPLALSDQEQLTIPVPTDTPLPRAFLFDGARLFVATGLSDVRIVELDGLRLGPSAPLPGIVVAGIFPLQLTLEGGILRAGLLPMLDSPEQVQYRVAPTELVPIDPVRYVDSNGDDVAPLVFHDGNASGLVKGGRTLLTFDLSEREAPRQVGSLRLPFPATYLYPTRQGELVALGGGFSAEPDQAIHLALLDVRAATAPAVLDTVSWGTETTLTREVPLYDAASGVLLVSEGPSAVPTTVQVVGTQGGALVLERRFPVGGGLVIDGDRIVKMRQNTVTSYPAGSGDPVTLDLARSAEAVRWIGDRLARFGGGSFDAQLLPPEPGDTLMAEGPSLNDVVQPPTGGTWLPRALLRDGQAYFARKPPAIDSGLGIYGLDVSEPGALLPGGSAFVAPPVGNESYLDVIQTQSSMIVARGQLGEPDYTPKQAGQALYPGTSSSFDVVDVSDPGAPRVAGRVELPEALASGGFGRWPTNATIDTAWGWQSFSRSAPLLVSGEVITSDHAQAVDALHQRFFADRIDVANPDAPALLPAVNIPGNVIAFDAASGSLISLETLRFEERASASDCARRGYASGHDHLVEPICHVLRHALNGLSLDGDVATRRSQLLLDDSRRSVAFAVSGDRVYYVTEPLLSQNEGVAYPPVPGQNTDMPFSVERVRMDHGQLQRLPSIDVTNLHEALPRDWQLYARGERLFTLSQNELGVIDTSVDPPSVRTLPLPQYGCAAFEVVGNTAYCSRRGAGLVAIDLNAAQ